MHFEAFRNIFVKMPLEMHLPLAEAQMFGDVSIDQALELGLFVCGSPATARKAFEARSL